MMPSVIMIERTPWLSVNSSISPLDDLHDRVLAQPEIAADQPVGQPFLMRGKHLLAFLSDGR
jgi:hypothetical protein